MIRAGIVLSVSLLSAVLPAGVYAGGEDPPGADGTTWGGEIRLHAGAINGDEGVGRTGGTLETRFFLDDHLTSRFRLFSELGSGTLEGTNEAGLHQLYFSYQLAESRDMSVTAGWIKIPFGRWDSVTLTRPLIKDRAFALGGESFFPLWRTSAGVAFDGAAGLLRMKGTRIIP